MFPRSGLFEFFSHSYKIVSVKILKSISSLCTVWHLCPLSRHNKVLSFVMRSFKDISVTGDKVFRWLSTIATSQISLYFGSEGFISKTPFKNRRTSGCSPNVSPSGKIIIDDNAERAVSTAL